MKAPFSIRLLATLLGFCVARSIAAPDPPPALYCDTAEYPPRQLKWTQSAESKAVNNVFPHPLQPERVLESSGSGLWVSDDAGRTWKALTQASAEKMGVVKNIAFHPLEPETFYVASATKGVWATVDAGQSFRQIGSTANGMAADASEDLIVYSGDPVHQTLMVVHGNAAGGISRTRDGGKTWDVLNADYCFRRILGRETNSSELFLYGSTKAEQEIPILYYCISPSELPVELMRDTPVTDLAFSPVREPAPLYVATSQNGLFRINSTHDDNVSLGSKSENWAGVSAFWGPSADAVGLCLYDPSKRGLVFSTNELAASQSSRGPLVSTFVKEGAVIRSNANGTVFYAVANGALTIGRSGSEVPVVSVTPCACEPSPEDGELLSIIAAGFAELPRLSATSSVAKAAADLRQRFGDLDAPYHHRQISITARVPVTPIPPASVTVDLSRLGGSAATPLYDDGEHGDGAAGDGTYGLSFSFRIPPHPPAGYDWRHSWPGRMAFGVTVSYADGQRQGAVAVLAVYPKIQSYNVWNEWNFFKTVFDTKGGAIAETVPRSLERPRGPLTLRVKTGKEPWSVSLPVQGRNDITGYQALAFRIKADEGAAPAEIYVQLRDRPELTAPIVTERFPLFAHGVPGAHIGSDYRRVVVPFSSLLGNSTQLETSRIDAIILSGDGETPSSFFIDGPRILATTDEPEPSQ